MIQLLPLVLGAIHWERATHEGAIIVYYTVLGTSPLLIHAGFWGLCATTVVFIVVSLLTEVEDPQAAREFIEATRPRLDGSEPGRTARETPADD